MTMRDELSAIAGPYLDKILAHPFWTGLCDGTLDPEPLWWFSEQDARYLVPTYARALAGASAIADTVEQAALLSAAASATFTAVSRMDGELSALAKELDRADDPATPVAPSPHAHTSFMIAAAATSFPAAAGGLLPMTWFHLTVCDHLRVHRIPGTRWSAWIDRYIPEDGYRDYVDAYLEMVDVVGGRCSAGERARLVAYFEHGARYELAFAYAAWRRQAWDY